MDEERYVLGIVLEPNDGKDGAPLDPDSQKDVYSREEIRQAAHKFMEDFRNLGRMHREFLSGAAKILESYIAPCDFAIGEQNIREGTWLLAIRIVDPSLWADIKDGRLTGFSIGGSAVRKPVQSVP
jgi:DNA adenine methylase